MPAPEKVISALRPGPKLTVLPTPEKDNPPWMAVPASRLNVALPWLKLIARDCSEMIVPELVIVALAPEEVIPKEVVPVVTMVPELMIVAFAAAGAEAMPTAKFAVVAMVPE